MSMQTIPAEVVSLLQHVELNQNNWWDKAIQRLVTGIIWHSEKKLDTHGLVHEIKRLLNVKLPLSKIEEVVNELCEKNDLIRLHDQTLKIPEKRLREFSEELRKAENIQEEAKENFINELSSRVSHLPIRLAEEVWISFNDDLLIPMVQKLGARTYSLISGARVTSNEIPAFMDYLEKQPKVLQDGIRTTVLNFMNPKNPVARSFIIRYLNAHFFVEASQLKGKTLRKINEIIEGKPVFNIFLDTNFLFSLLELHDNPSNEAALSLVSLVSTIKDFADVNLYVYPLTIDEAKVVIKGTLHTCKEIDFQDNLTEAILLSDAELTGMIRKYAQEKKSRGITPEEYFEPYLLQLIELAAHKGVRLYNEDVEALRNNQVLKGEIEYQLELQKKYTGRKQKSYFTLEHDIVLWHFIKSKRPPRVENPLKALYWVATIDFGLLGYDAHKRKHNPEDVAICLHPTALIHMLQFWIPRNESFDKAILDSLRLPFLFQAFDEKDEVITSNILKRLSSFKDLDKLSVKMLTGLLVNRALRQKIEETADINEQVEIVKEFIASEEKTLRSRIAELQDERKIGDEKQKELEKVIEQNEAAMLQTEYEKNLLAQRVKDIEKQNLIDKERNHFAVKWFLAPLGINLLCSFLLNLLGILLFENAWKLVYPLIIFILILFVHVLVVDNLGTKRTAISSWVYFEKFHNAKVWVVSSLLVLLGGLITDALYDYLKYILTGSR